MSSSKIMRFQLHDSRTFPLCYLASYLCHNWLNTNTYAQFNITSYTAYFDSLSVGTLQTYFYGLIGAGVALVIIFFLLIVVACFATIPRLQRGKRVLLTGICCLANWCIDDQPDKKKIFSILQLACRLPLVIPTLKMRHVLQQFPVSEVLLSWIGPAKKTNHQ